jgi:hypothetical protein
MELSYLLRTGSASPYSIAAGVEVRALTPGEKGVILVCGVHHVSDRDGLIHLHSDNQSCAAQK